MLGLIIAFIDLYIWRHADMSACLQPVFKWRSLLSSSRPKSSTMTLLSATMHDDQRMFHFLLWPWVSGPHTTPHVRLRALCAPQRAPVSPETLYMARSVHSAIGCFTTATNLLLELYSYAETGEKGSVINGWHLFQKLMNNQPVCWKLCGLIKSCWVSQYWSKIYDVAAVLLHGIAFASIVPISGLFGGYRPTVLRTVF